MSELKHRPISYSQDLERQIQLVKLNDDSIKSINGYIVDLIKKDLAKRGPLEIATKGKPTRFEDTPFEEKLEREAATKKPAKEAPKDERPPAIPNNKWIDCVPFSKGVRTNGLQFRASVMGKDPQIFDTKKKAEKWVADNAPF